MGLLDILNSIGHTSAPSGQPQSSSHMSKLAIALIGLLAYKAMTRPGGITGHAGQATTPNAAPAGNGGGGLGGMLGGMLGGGALGGALGGGLNDILGKLGSAAQAGGSGGTGGGNLNDILQGGLGQILGGAAGGSVVSGGLDEILKQLQNAGHGDVAKSWIGTGENKEIAPDDLGRALGADSINALSSQTGLSRNDLLAGLAQQLPQLVDQLTPHGRLPTEQEASRMV
jgi:uncharacterized protein YidB (DUF937 family)